MKRNGVGLALLALALACAEARAEDPGEVAQKQVETILGQYRNARRVFGDSHVLLTAVIYGATDRSRESKDAGLRSGAAGLIAIPLGGFGAGHGADWWPRLQTDDEASVMLAFDRRVTSYFDALERAGKVAPEEAAARFERRARLFDELLEAEGQRSRARAREGSAGCTSEWVIERPEQLRACLDALRASTAAADVRLDQLEALWREYQRLKGMRARGRHTLLIGPTFGLSLNDETLAMWGVLAELGFPIAGYPVRVALSGGIVRPRNDPFAVGPSPDWWAGVGLSGQFGDELFNGLRGANGAGVRP